MTSWRNSCHREAAGPAHTPIDRLERALRRGRLVEALRAVKSSSLAITALRDQTSCMCGGPAASRQLHPSVRAAKASLIGVSGDGQARPS